MACGGNNNSSTPASADNAGSAADTTTTDTPAADTNADAATDANANADANTDAAASTEDSDLAYVQSKGTLVVGITDFEPMDYKDADGNWIGFDAEMAKAFGESLGVDVEFIEIDWDNKIMELDGKTIDCVWNGMTLTSEVTSSMECSNAYCNNAQVVIVPADVADQYQDTDSLADLTFAVEAGSAGEEMAEEYSLNYTPVKAQSDALMEVAAGTSDAAIIDSLMAAAMVGEGTGYADLTYTVGLNSEEYGVGFRKGSDLAAALNDFFDASLADGSMMACAEEYGVQAAIVE
ncbi:MAG: transporter substrate-binding domain-containing protein [Lachnospiraceae bacterium]|nr:transporter substrate-binding domain-containing protein [Lachnospiraceae bacterium]